MKTISPLYSTINNVQQVKGPAFGQGSLWCSKTNQNNMPTQLTNEALAVMPDDSILLYYRTHESGVLRDRAMVIMPDRSTVLHDSRHREKVDTQESIIGFWERYAKAVKEHFTPRQS